MSKNIGFISTRFAGQDGVSLESAKWAEVLWEDRHISYWYSGQSDRSPEISHVVPRSVFWISENKWINERIWDLDQEIDLFPHESESCQNILKVHYTNLLINLI